MILLVREITSFAKKLPLTLWPNDYFPNISEFRRCKWIFGEIFRIFSPKLLGEMIFWQNIRNFFPLTLGGNDYLAKYSWIYSHDSKIETVFPLVWCGTDSGVTHQWIINWIQLRSIELDSNCNSLFVKKDLPFPPTPWELGEIANLWF